MDLSISSQLNLNFEILMLLSHACFALFPSLTTFLFLFFLFFLKSVPPCLVRLRQFVLGASGEIHATPPVQRTPLHFESIMKSILLFERYDSQNEKPFKHLIQSIRIENMRQTKKDLFEIIRQQSEVIEYWMEKALDKSGLKV